MGSKMRHLRAKAGVTGLDYQKRQREAYRIRERAGRTERAKLEFQDGNIIVSTSSPGGQLRSSEQLRAGLTQAAFAVAMPGFASDLELHNRFLESSRKELAYMIGPPDGAAELADCIHQAALARAYASVHPNHEVVEEVWDQALAELRRAVPPAELSALLNLQAGKAAS